MTLTSVKSTPVIPWTSPVGEQCVHNWVQNADLEPRGGCKPDKVALDGTVLKIEGEQYWFVAAVEPSTNRILHAGLYSQRNMAMTSLYISFGIVLMIWVKYLLPFRGVVRTKHMEREIEPDESVSTAVVRAVSAVDGRKPTALPPLNDALDPDALDAIFDPRADGAPRTGGHLSFVFSGYSVTVDNGEYLTVQPLENRARATSGRTPNSNDR